MRDVRTALALGGLLAAALVAAAPASAHPSFEKRPFLGVQLTDLTPELKVHFGAPGEAGVLVSRVVEDSPAARAGLLVGDLVTTAGGAAVTSAHDLVRTLKDRAVGEAVELEVVRQGQAVSLSAILEEREWGGHDLARRMIFRCGEGEDCDAAPFPLLRVACGGDEDCEAKIECHEGECACTVNGEAVDCPRHGFLSHGR